MTLAKVEWGEIGEARIARANAEADARARTHSEACAIPCAACLSKDIRAVRDALAARLLTRARIVMREGNAVAAQELKAAAEWVRSAQ